MTNIKFYCLLFLYLFSLPAFAEAGTVAFALGKANVEKGDKIEVGQTILTGDNGHVHIRFIDGALISMRPNSKITVETYQYDPEDPDNNFVKFFLETGVVRSITGKAGKLNKKGFRMNTPISAIGIRGTDYTVYATPDKTRVFVNEGGIGLSPLDEECKKESFGICQTNKLVELFAGDEYILELNSSDDKARLIDLSNILNNPTLQLNESIGTSLLDNDNTLIPRTSSQTPDIGWANWANYQQVLNTLFTPMQPYFNDDWRITTANSMFGLFVANDFIDTPKTGSLNFKLDRYQAFTLQNQQYATAYIDNPNLNVNFDKNTFTTSFGVSSSQLQTTIEGAGDLTRLGFLLFESGDTKIHGSLNAQQNQAGLLFEKTIDQQTKVVGSSAWIQK
jgi:hypothetical protein